jgi:hypothetical protein
MRSVVELEFKEPLLDERVNTVFGFTEAIKRPTTARMSAAAISLEILTPTSVTVCPMAVNHKIAVRLVMTLRTLSDIRKVVRNDLSLRANKPLVQGNSELAQ